MRHVKEGVAVTIEIQSAVRTGDADPNAGTIGVSVRKWKQGDGEDGYYYTGTAWQSGAAVVASTQGDFHAHTVTIDVTRMASLAGFDISARPADALAVGPATWLHVDDDFNSKSRDTIDAKTTNLPTDPADESLQQAAHTATQADIAASELAIRGADSDTLETLSDQLDAVAVPTGSRNITIHVQDGGAADIESCFVSVYTSDNVTFITRGTTDSGGDLIVALDDGTYAVRLSKSLYGFTVPETMVVTADATKTFSGTAFSAPTPSAADYCVIYGTVRDAAGQPLIGAEVDAYATTPQALSAIQVSKRIASATTDAVGYFELELVKLTEVRFSIEDAGRDETLTVPNAANQDASTWT